MPVSLIILVHDHIGLARQVWYERQCCGSICSLSPAVTNNAPTVQYYHTGRLHILRKAAVFERVIIL